MVILFYEEHGSDAYQYKIHPHDARMFMDKIDINISHTFKNINMGTLDF